MKKVLLIMPTFCHGGTVRSAISLMKHYDKTRYKIDVFCLQRYGELESYFKDYNIIDQNIELASYIGLSKIYKKLNFGNKIKAMYYYIKRKLFGVKKEKLFKKIARKIVKNKNYDCVIAFQEGMVTEFVTYIPVERKIAWIMCDYARYLTLVNRDEANIYNKYNDIVCVSKTTADSFIKCIPSVKDKVHPIYVMLDNEKIINSSKVQIEDIKFDTSKFTIVSIGRMDPVKQFSKIPLIANELKEKELQFKWYIIGDGGDEKSKVIDEIKKYNLENDVILLGSKENPYYYLNKANLFVCVSESEACPNVINEAKILNKAILTNSFPAAYEFIVSGENGIICDINEMSKYIDKFINDKEFYKKIIDGIKGFTYDNESIIKEIDNLIVGE